MNLVTRLMGGARTDGATAATGATPMDDTANGALDTLCCVLRTMGEVSFSIEDKLEPGEFQALCASVACHVENGAAVPELDIAATDAGTRNWGQLRRFYIDRR